VLHARRIRETHNVPQEPLGTAAAERIDDVQHSHWPSHGITIKHKVKNTKKHKLHKAFTEKIFVPFVGFLCAFCG
jgi:hypothetical protein